MGDQHDRAGPPVGLAAARRVLDGGVVSAPGAISVATRACRSGRRGHHRVPARPCARSSCRPDLNPTVAPPFYYVVPLPRFDQTFDALQVMSGGYPLGAIVSTSGSHWDARGGVTNATPARSRVELKDHQPPAMPQLVIGGGITPLPGLRFGAGFATDGTATLARPRWTCNPTTRPRRRSRRSPWSCRAADATVTNIEAEYAFGHTRMQGEWVWDRFETTTSPATATAFFVQATQTFTPRWFGAARVTSVSTPMLPDPTSAHARASVVETIAGYRLTRDFTLRGGYYAERHFNGLSWDHQLCVSIVWARLWR